MKQSYGVLTAKLTNGKKVIAKNNLKEEVTLFVDQVGTNVWLTAEGIAEKVTSPIAVFGTTEKGDSFVAKKNSRRTKLMAWLAANPEKTEKDCTLDKKVQGEPLYVEGEEVFRTVGQKIHIGFLTIEEYKAAKEMQAVAM